MGTIRDEIEAAKADPSTSLAATYNSGIEKALSILDEMMVGEPMKAEIQHGKSHGLAYTEIVVEEGEMGHLMFYGHDGTDGEEVTVMVLRDGQD